MTTIHDFSHKASLDAQHPDRDKGQHPHDATYEEIVESISRVQQQNFNIDTKVKIRQLNFPAFNSVILRYNWNKWAPFTGRDYPVICQTAVGDQPYALTDLIYVKQGD